MGLNYFLQKLPPCCFLFVGLFVVVFVVGVCLCVCVCVCVCVFIRELNGQRQGKNTRLGLIFFSTTNYLFVVFGLFVCCFFFVVEINLIPIWCFYPAFVHLIP